jgi:hypothetical protein
MSAGFFNSDSFEDLAIGSPFAESNRGEVNVIYGSSDGLSHSPVSSTGRFDQLWSQKSPSVEESPEAGDLFGYSLTSADFNADGRDDLAIGAIGESVGTKQNVVAVNVIHGSASGLSATTVPDQLWHQDSANVNDSSESGDSLGILDRKLE